MPESIKSVESLTAPTKRSFLHLGSQLGSKKLKKHFQFGSKKKAKLYTVDNVTISDLNLELRSNALAVINNKMRQLKLLQFIHSGTILELSTNWKSFCDPMVIENFSKVALWLNLPISYNLAKLGKSSGNLLLYSFLITFDDQEDLNLNAFSFWFPLVTSFDFPASKDTNYNPVIKSHGIKRDIEGFYGIYSSNKYFMSLYHKLLRVATRLHTFFWQIFDKRTIKHELSPERLQFFKNWKLYLELLEAFTLEHINFSILELISEGKESSLLSYYKNLKTEFQLKESFDFWTPLSVKDRCDILVLEFHTESYKKLSNWDNYMPLTTSKREWKEMVMLEAYSEFNITFSKVLMANSTLEKFFELNTHHINASEKYNLVPVMRTGKEVMVEPETSDADADSDYSTIARTKLGLKTFREQKIEFMEEVSSTDVRASLDKISEKVLEDLQLLLRCLEANVENKFEKDLSQSNLSEHDISLAKHSNLEVHDSLLERPGSENGDFEIFLYRYITHLLKTYSLGKLINVKLHRCRDILRRQLEVNLEFVDTLYDVWEELMDFCENCAISNHLSNIKHSNEVIVNGKKCRTVWDFVSFIEEERLVDFQGDVTPIEQIYESMKSVSNQLESPRSSIRFDAMTFRSVLNDSILKNLRNHGTSGITVPYLFQGMQPIFCEFIQQWRTLVLSNSIVNVTGFFLNQQSDSENKLSQKLTNCVDWQKFAHRINAFVSKRPEFYEIELGTKTIISKKFSQILSHSLVESCPEAARDAINNINMETVVTQVFKVDGNKVRELLIWKVYTILCEIQFFKFLGAINATKRSLLMRNRVVVPPSITLANLRQISDLIKKNFHFLDSHFKRLVHQYIIILGTMISCYHRLFQPIEKLLNETFCM